eukprot:6501557-Ditylum_brightwellii.AAC.1
MVDKEDRFLKHYVKNIQGGHEILATLPKKNFLWTIEERLNLELGLLITHFGRRSAATALADAGISITNLKQA